MYTMVRRKCFISYHHADQAEVNAFIRTFDHQRNLFIARGLGLGSEMSADIINSTNTDYVMSRIRQLYLADSTVTLLMLGRNTWSRRYVDWELQSSLRSGETIIPNGLLAIKLPSFPITGGMFPQRLDANLLGIGVQYNPAIGQDCYARWIQYPSSSEVLMSAIEEAYQRRQSHRRFISNSREYMRYNRS